MYDLTWLILISWKFLNSLSSNVEFIMEYGLVLDDEEWAGEAISVFNIWINVCY